VDILSVGELLIDFLPGDEAGVYIRKAGGAPANVAIAAARNGLNAGFCGAVGDDDFGHFLYDTLKENGVMALRKELVTHAVTTMAFVTLDETGNRSFTFARKPGADMFLKKEDIRDEWLENSRIIHAGSCSMSKMPASEATVHALRQGHEKGKLVSFDVNYRNLLWDDDRGAAAKAVREILPLVDFLKISQEETDMVDTGGGIAAMAKENGIAAVVETLGENGARCYWNGKLLMIPGRPAKCVDTTGAGDAFWGGFLSRLLKSGVNSVPDLSEELLRDAMEYGNIAGWLCVQKKGAIESLPTGEEIEAHRK